ncbi:MAG: NADPH:quinone oxidoreductase family protein [Paracoccaceae bacterium]|nr:NADPH:quinone oxidoreductase family protein [Paracoccaceae bacterium]MDG1207746.1 NADPH:quinone oxidoreductase family protein [Paracoccaceae bacterium]MDG1371778.1 NADPH:quinone oxidoreductase family protein [Paracoccaceae bacterium]
MRQITCPAYGPPETLEVEEVPTPSPTPGQVLVRHRAWGINYVDMLMCAGGYQLKPDLPFTPGGEAAGDVIALGEGVEGITVGDRVMISGRYGLFAEVAAVDRAGIQPLPTAFDYAQGAAFKSVYMTAWNALNHGAHLRPGEVLLVHGAAGGVGLAAVHIGRMMGAIVIGTAGSDAKLDVVKAEGADHVINYTDGFKDQVKALTGGRGADVIYDPVGGAVAEESFKAMNYGCRILYIGFTGGPPVQIRSNLLLIKGASAIGFRAGEIGRRIPGLNERTMHDLIALAEAGRLRPHISHRTAWPDVAAAMAPIQNRTVIGKSVMEIP